MEQARIDRRHLSLQARRRVAHQAAREAVAVEASQPLAYAAGADPAVDEDLLARIDAVLSQVRDHATAPQATTR
ncbi:MAG: hypothetical protein ACR2HR_10340 [Euzebya sp.]